ncbi:beta-1,3-galactosyl-O-glycosyl-glycoprotein beta-1,6-N-acetylglucosaminyltransferase-like [Mya arenaria]|uniref:beta-1,3-galactosyl-O-glycosyl-glycoprotein beta-1,6-N-acetylglucosaminyltransferase-like n=1 Tax=Mya arenaria TaxID=6604 RepID=UPI0022E80B9F|nr:beta-1,3-galactosyl-O-glycosyl-glycoprotein beta-1,6-N-acetylglucosaminyltransferase-like [Mya arenaria]
MDVYGHISIKSGFNLCLSDVSSRCSRSSRRQMAQTTTIKRFKSSYAYVFLLLTLFGFMFYLSDFIRYSPGISIYKFDKEGRANVSGILNILPTVNSPLLQDSYFIQDRKVKEVNCAAIFDGDENETALAERIASTENRTFLQPADYMNMTSNCSKFILDRGYITDQFDKLENEFPIAFSILMFAAIEQAERLFRAIYRPQNFYCFHIDAKTDNDLYDAMSRVAACFNNVHVMDKRVDVRWGQMSVLEPELLCMEFLWNRSAKWKYFINLTGQEFPLKTNYELVRILQAYNGSNDIEGTINRANTKRWADAGPPPHGVVPTKGAVHIIASRGYVDFVLHDPIAAGILYWSKKTAVPDETFFSTLNHNPSLAVPGSYKGIPETEAINFTSSGIKPFVARFKNWGVGNYNWPCHGMRVRMVCVFGVGDLPALSQRRELFANKFYDTFHPYTLDCMEEWHFNRTRDQYLGSPGLDVRWYEELGFVKNKVQ